MIYTTLAHHIDEFEKLYRTINSHRRIELSKFSDLMKRKIKNNINLENAYPNPFKPSTTIRFSLPKNEKVRLEIYDMRGRLVNSLIDSEFISAGSYESAWNGKNNRGENVSSGVYLARITTGSYVQSIKLNLLK